MNDLQNSIEYFNQIPSSSGLYTDSSVQMANMLSTLAQSEEELAPKFIKYVNAKIEEFKDMRVEFSVIKAGYYEGEGKYKEAMETMMVIQDEKNFSNQHKYYLANLYEKEKKYEESTALVMGIIEKEPKNAHAWNFLGYSLLVRGEEIEKAYDYIQKALKINPEDGYIRDSLGWYYFKKGQTSKALKELELAFKRVPDDIEIIKHLALVHRELKNYKRAKIYFESALKLVRYQVERQEIMGLMTELEGERIPASEKLD
jgi:tetratricopeptide (TPR) repeat protein